MCDTLYLIIGDAPVVGVRGPRRSRSQHQTLMAFSSSSLRLRGSASRRNRGQRGAAESRRDMTHSITRPLLHQREVWRHPAGARHLLHQHPAQALRHDGLTRVHL